MFAYIPEINFTNIAYGIDVQWKLKFLLIKTLK